MTLDELWPGGELCSYEGDDPDGFAREIADAYGIDVHATPPDYYFQCMRHLFYGDIADVSRRRLIEELGIDMHAPPPPDDAGFDGDDYVRDPWDARVVHVDPDGTVHDWQRHAFWIPAGLVEAVHRSGRWPLGS
jgi:hypothetical protein